MSSVNFVPFEVCVPGPAIAASCQFTRMVPSTFRPARHPAKTDDFCFAPTDTFWGACCACLRDITDVDAQAFKAKLRRYWSARLGPHQVLSGVFGRSSTFRTCAPVQVLFRVRLPVGMLQYTFLFSFHLRRTGNDVT